ncbi:MAG TPA: amidohydrolase family protein, partial [Aggregatilineales bacterium]|nr:amidohydrolase family protein [Aggregatilineales bacterium]
MLIKNGTLIQDLNTLHKNYALRIENDRITDTGSSPALEAKYSGESVVINAKGSLIMPGSICAHTHFYGAYARGLAIPGPAPEDFPDILRRLWWSLDKALDRDAVRMSAMVSLVDAIKHGTTTLIDHHASPNFIDGSLDVIADAVESAGLRAVLCYEVTDRGGAKETQAGIDENVRFIKAAEKRSRLA